MLERYEFLEHIKLDNINVGQSAYIILDSYAFALGHNDYIEQKFHELKDNNLSLCDSDLTEGGYLHVRCVAGI
jgi:hypothetical protein